VDSSRPFAVVFDGKAHIPLPLLSLFYFIFLLFLLFLSERLVIVAPTKITNDTRPFFRRRRPLTGTRRLCIAPADDRQPGPLCRSVNRPTIRILSLLVPPSTVPFAKLINLIYTAVGKEIN
jgi:hypothetical protein